MTTPQETDNQQTPGSNPWTAETLKAACECIAFDSSGMLIRTRLEGRISPTQGAARDVALLAKAMAEEFGLRTWLGYRNRIVTITFERQDARQSD